DGADRVPGRRPGPGDPGAGTFLRVERLAVAAVFVLLPAPARTRVVSAELLPSHPVFVPGSWVFHAVGSALPEKDTGQTIRSWLPFPPQGVSERTPPSSRYNAPTSSSDKARWKRASASNRPM